MTNSLHLKFSNFRFEIEKEFGAFYTGGKVSWSKDASKIYCQNGSKINIVNIETVSIVGCIGSSVDDEELEDQIYTFALSPSHDFIVSAHKSALLKLWSIETGETKLLKMWKSLHHGPISKLEFNEDQTLVASAGIDGIIRLWNFNLQVCAATLRGCQGVISALKFTKSVDEQEWVVAVGDDHTINAFNLSNGKMEKQFKSHFSTVTDFVFTKDFMVSSGRDKVLILWNFEEIKHIRTIPVYESVEAMHVLPSSKKLPGTDGI